MVSLLASQGGDVDCYVGFNLFVGAVPSSEFCFAVTYVVVLLGCGSGWDRHVFRNGFYVDVENSGSHVSVWGVGLVFSIGEGVVIYFGDCVVKGVTVRVLRYE